MVNPPVDHVRSAAPADLARRLLSACTALRRSLDTQASNESEDVEVTCARHLAVSRALRDEISSLGRELTRMREDTPGLSCEASEALDRAWQMLRETGDAEAHLGLAIREQMADIRRRLADLHAGSKALRGYAKGLAR